MPRLHRGERRRRYAGVALAAGLLTIAPACSSAKHPAVRVASTTTTTTAPPAPSSTSVSTANGVVTIKGHGDLTVPLPAAVALPAIAHAHFAGKGSFVVSGVDADAKHITVLASSLGPYDGTFPVGFVDSANDATVSMRIATREDWQIDIGSAVLAPSLGKGQSGVGDAVIAYRGRAATAHLTYTGRGPLIVNLYENGGLIPLVNTKGRYDGPISLVAGPEFIAVTTTGKWSMIIQ